MEFEYFDEFFVLAEEKNFSKAADKLYISQSALTKHMQKFESYLNVKLFNRTSPLTLTPAAVLLRDELKIKYDELWDIIDEARKVSAGYAGTLSIGFGNYSKTIYAPDAILFQKSNPEVKMNMSIKDQNELYNELRNDNVDIATLYGIIGAPNDILRGFMSMPITSGKMAILVNKDDPKFRNKSEISIKELNSMKCVQINNAYYRMVYNSIHYIAQKNGMNLRNVTYEPSIEDALLHVLMYGGFFFVPGGNTVSYGPEYKKIEIKENYLRYRRYYVWKMENANTSIMKYIKIARDRRAADISKKVLEKITR